MSDSALYDEKLLFSKIAGGDELAFTELFHIYTPKLFPFVLKLVRNEHLAKEMIQETFLRLWVKREELIKVEQPASWIFRIASNVSISCLRSQTNRQRILNLADFKEESQSLTEELDSRELDLVIREAVQSLPEKRREVYRLSREKGFTHKEIAEHLHITQNTVKDHIGIALKFIREFINKKTGLSIATLALLLGH